MTKKIDLRNIARHWAIEPDALHAITESLAGLSLLPQRRLENTRTATVRDGVAVIPITGVITPRLDVFTALFGGTALDELAHNIKTALTDTNIRAILLDIDSPGGVAVGTSEMAEIIHQAGKTKPVWAYVGRNCCSAAYWLASATDRIVAHRSAILGSIGVVSTMSVQEQPDADGYRHIDIVSSNAKNKRPDPRTPEGLEAIRSELDALEREFISSVAEYRHIPTDTIQKDFGNGGVKIGADAVAAGMADELATYEETINKLTKKGEQTMPSTSEAKITAEYLAEKHPDIVSAFKEQGATAERNRILALEEVSCSGYEEMLVAAKANPEMTAEKLAVQIVKAEKEKGSKHIAALKAADSAMPQITPTAPTQESVGATPEERATHEWNTNASIRAEFGGDKEAFVAFKTAQENGQIKIQTKGK